MAIEKEINKGITKTTIQNIERITGSRAQQTYKEALKPLVNNKEMLDILSTEHNIQKIKNRFEIQLHIQEGTKILGTINTIGKTLIEASNDMRELIQEIGILDTKYPKPLTDFLKKHRYGILTLKENGTIKHVHATLIFRKEK